MDFGSFIAGVLATLLGFVCSVAWDQYKYNRDTQHREAAVVAAVREELVANIAILERHQTHLKQERSVLAEGKSIVAPLQLLEVGAADLLKIDLPARFAAHPDLLTDVRRAAQLTGEVNEAVRSRETYRMHNEAMNNFSGRMEIYDNLLTTSEDDLLRRLRALEGRLH